MKKIVIGCGNVLIDISAWIWLILIIIASKFAFEQDMAQGFGVLLGGLLLFVTIFYFTYLLMDISDSLKTIIKNTSKENKITEND